LIICLIGVSKLALANTLAFGTRAGILNVVGTQLGLILMIGLLAIGFQVVAKQLEWFLIVIRFTLQY
jgi:threonine/homoserine/homoserine lactone efflux protein